MTHQPHKRGQTNSVGADAGPELHVMLMSGGDSGNILVLNYGWAYIQKPFVAEKLVQMIKEVLHSENRSQLGGREFDSRKDIKNRNRDKSKRQRSLNCGSGLRRCGSGGGFALDAGGGRGAAVFVARGDTQT
jgi:hypothetical protein